MNKDNINDNVSVVISSCLVNSGKFNCLHNVIDNLRYFLPDIEIIIGFDKVGPNNDQKEILNSYTNLVYFTHAKGLGFSFNEGSRLSKHKIVLQIEDDWIISNRYLENSNDVKILLFNCYLVLNKYKNTHACVRLDGGMFDEIGGSDGYPLGSVKHQYNNKFIYYEYNLPTEQQMNDNWWLHYAFSNHPHLKFKNTTLSNPYPEDIDPGSLENTYSVEWILKNYPIFYIPINEESIKVCGITNPDKNIFKHIGYEFSYRP
jgi:hypothetical protein